MWLALARKYKQNPQRIQVNKPESVRTWSELCAAFYKEFEYSLRFGDFSIGITSNGFLVKCCYSSMNVCVCSSKENENEMDMHACEGGCLCSATAGSRFTHLRGERCCNRPADMRPRINKKLLFKWIKRDTKGPDAWCAVILIHFYVMLCRTSGSLIALIWFMIIFTNAFHRIPWRKANSLFHYS